MRVEAVIERIEKSTFTGKGDKPKVIAMYEECQSDCDRASETLARARVGVAAKDALPIPSPNIPPTRLRNLPLDS